MRKSIIFSIILFIITGNLEAQIPIGIKHDVNGMPFNGYFDPLSYAPENKLTVWSGNTDKNGRYCDNNGHIKEGYIKFLGRSISFKKYKEDDYKKVKIKHIKYFIIGVDSFYVVEKNTRVGEVAIYQSLFAQNIAKIKDYTFARLYSSADGDLFHPFKRKDETEWELSENSS